MAVGPVGHFMLALVVAVSSLGSGSLLWPRLTDRPRPKLLADVHDVVLATDVGRNAAVVLGVSDEANITPINLGEVAASAVNSVKGAIGGRIQKIIVGNAVNQLSRQMNNLSPEQKTLVEEAICKPNPTPADETSPAN